jgi:hypothetical protein
MLVNMVEKLMDYQLAKSDSLFDYILKLKIINLTVANAKCGRGTAKPEDNSFILY